MKVNNNLFRSRNMSNEKSQCQKPDQLKGKPEDCSPEQIKKCHGDTQDHPCTEPPKDE